MKKPGVEVGLFVARIDAFESRFGGPISNQHHALMRTERLYCSVCVFLLQCHGRLRRSITRSAKELRPRKKAVSFRYMPRVRASLSIAPTLSCISTRRPPPCRSSPPWEIVRRTAGSMVALGRTVTLERSRGQPCRRVCQHWSAAPRRSDPSRRRRGCPRTR